jgi:hypothetical protein
MKGLDRGRDIKERGAEQIEMQVVKLAGKLAKLAEAGSFSLR